MSAQPFEQADPSLNFANRASDLLTNNTWMDAPTAVTLAQQPTPDSVMHAQAQAVGTQLANSWDGYEQQFFDPILQSQPSAAQATADYVHSVLGPPPATSGITDLQKALITDGFLQSSPTGVWDKETEDAYNRAVNTLRQQQYAGAPKKGGNPFTSTVSALYHAVVHDVTHPWDAAVGWYDGAADAIGYTGGWISTGFGTLGTAKTQAHLSANITRALGHHVTDAQANAAYTGSIGHRLLEAGGNALAIGGATSVGKSVAKQIAAQTLKGVAEQASAKVAQGVTDEGLTKLEKVGLAMSTAQRMGFVGRSVNDVSDALRAGTLPADHALVRRNLGVVSKTLLKTPARVIAGNGSRVFAVAGDGETSLLTGTWRDAVPGLARLAPVATKIASGANEGGWAYTTRNAMATPYRLAPVRAAGIVAQRAEIGSLAAHGVAGLVPGSSLQQEVAGAHTTLDAWLDNATWNPIPGFAIGPETLLLGPLHGDLIGAGRASKVIGATVHDFQNKLANRLGDLGVEAPFQAKLGLNPQQLIDMAGGEGRLRLWINNKVNDYAADTYADRQMAQGFTHTFSGGDAAQEDAIGAHRNAWYQMSHADRQQWVDDTAKTDSHYMWLSKRIESDILRGAVDPKTAIRASMDEFFNNAETMQQLIKDGLPNFVVGPAGQSVLSRMGAAQDAEAVAATTGNLPSGALGLQRTNILTRHEIVNVELPKLQKAWSDADAKLKAAQAAHDMKAYDVASTERREALDDAIGFAHVQFNLDASRLGVFEHDANGLFQAIKTRAAQRADEVLPTFDQPDWMAEKIKDLKARGYRIVVGSHIGHVYDDTLPNFTDLNGFYTPLRKWAGRVGLDPGRIPDAAIGHAIKARQDTLTHKFLTETPDAVLNTRRADFRTVRAVLQDPALKRELPRYAASLLALFSKVGLNKTEIQRIVNETGVTKAEAGAILEDRIAGQFGPRDIPRKQLMQALTTTHDVAGPGGPFTWTKVDAKTATGILNAYAKGYSLPGYVMGWENIENWARASHGFLGKVVERNPDNSLAQAVANWPNKLVRARNTLRFTVSPVFAARVSFKQRYKAALEGVRIPFNPAKALMEQHADKTAMEALTRLDGKVPHEQMDADRYLMARDVFGLHDSQWDAAYFIHDLKQQGKTPAEISEAYNKVFKYGADGGRTAVERSANTIFFPFSFEKTLLRNTGAFLADKPGQALALDLAVEAWRDADKNGQIGQWVQDRLPILREMQLLNAFAHGISPGQFGGINATFLNDAKGGSEALLNLFLPQAWGTAFTKPNLAKYMPVWDEFKNLWADTAQQKNILGAAAHDTIRAAVAHTWKDEPVLTDRAQVSAALSMRAKLWSDKGLMSIVDYDNNQTDDASKYLWPSDSRLPVAIWGKPVNKTTLTAYIQSVYPAYNPDAGAAFAKDQAQQITAFIHQIGQTDPATAQQMTAFRQVADSVVSHLNRDDYDAATAAQTQEQFRQGMAAIGSKDKRWADLYNQFYAWALGQIQTPAQKAKAVTA